MKEITASFKHSANCGDLVYALSGIKSLCEKKNYKAVIYQRLGVTANYYQGAVHPLGNIMMNEPMWDMMRPLLLAQPYIKDALEFAGEPAHVDLDIIRHENIGMPNSNIAKWYAYVYPDMHSDLSKAWLSYTPNENIVDAVKNSIIVNLTQRYRNDFIDYAFLQHAHRDTPILFTGVQKEYNLFKMRVPRAQFITFVNFDHLACAIDNCKFFVGNQSFCFAVAEALKVKRILECCAFAPNVDCVGENGFDFYKQSCLEYYVEQLNKSENP